jgi:hypothetical protein
VCEPFKIYNIFVSSTLPSFSFCYLHTHNSGIELEDRGACETQDARKEEVQIKLHCSVVYIIWGPYMGPKYLQVTHVTICLVGKNHLYL